ncbi:AAR035Cp [Eremothecium gossypii ATCC 10895]|uniref:AAR035Cp n=1 Tax=Eremothecium gossypii (strain ATCC 10895 / CBS 109.51 / FGSC 9923 / NRRL Y-1056) TaxID=284811 RepID=Q75EP4_EREGS|nr:AAR035Cp [Eremothecium gossypii ATCC 10895]AAS50400.2 AAR035Cp [Eremothecium gossypii ATCC 10895]AEY94686.1 FAAR035Cp [Eremothecium gossypii FDAG1]
MSLGILSHVDGSSKFSTAAASAICGVSGPIEPKARQEIPQHLALDVIVRPAAGPPTTREKLLEDKVRATITPVVETFLHPRQLCQITLQVLKSVGQHEHMELAVALNAAYLALLDAGVPLRAVLSAVSIAVSTEGELTQNPSPAELQDARSVFTAAFSVADGVNTLLLLDGNGTFEESTVSKVLELAEKECVRLAGELRHAVKEKLEKDFIWKK